MKVAGISPFIHLKCINWCLYDTIIMERNRFCCFKTKTCGKPILQKTWPRWQWQSGKSVWTSNYFFTRGPCKLHINAQTLNIWFATGLSFKDMVSDKILKFFNRSIALSTWIRSLAILRVCFTSNAVRRFPFPQVHFFCERWYQQLSTSLKK